MTEPTADRREPAEGMPIGALPASALVGVMVADDERVLEANDRCLAMLLRDRADLDAGMVRLHEITPPEHWLLDERALHAVTTTGHCAPYEKELIRGDGTRLPVRVEATLQTADPLRWSCMLVDLSEMRRAEDAHRFLWEAGRLLASTLDRRQALKTVAYLAVPQFADWCTVHIVEDGEIRTVEMIHRDPAAASLTRRLRERYPPNPDMPSGAYRVMHTGEPVLYSSIDDDLLKETTRDGEHVRILRELGTASAMVVPLMVRGEVLGTLSFVRGMDAPPYTSDDLVLAERLADRTAVAVDNARLFEGARNDLRELERVRRQLERTNARLNLLADTANRLLTSENPRDLVRGLFRRLSTELGLEVYFNYLVEDVDGQPRLRLDSWAGVDEATAHEWEWLAFGEAVSGRAAAIRDRIVVEHIDASNDPLVADLQEMGVTAYASHPLMAHGRLVGTLGLGTRRRPAFEADELALMRIISDQIAVTLDRAGLIRQLQVRAEELTRATNARDELLAVVSHDLRNSLGAILSYINLLRRLHPDAEGAQARYLDGIRLAGQWMHHYIQDLLDVAQMESGSLRVTPAPEALDRLVEEAMSMLRPLAADRDQALVVEVPAETPLVLVDRARFVQVLTNLVGNAIKFAPDSGRIEMHAEPLGDVVRISITDNGPGIRPEDADAIFQRFWQGDKGDRRGTGLGLAIARRIVEEHGGEIGFSSEPGQGTTFFFTLPRAEGPGV
ncbi:MAG: ATP-binding protein [Gemmatimonadota bacterium]